MMSSSNSDYWFDEAAADRAVKFFTRFLRHTKGQWYGQPFLLQEWQRELVRNLFGWKRADGTRRYRTCYVEVPRKNGKALAIDTPIPTPTGWTTMGEIKVGDWVFDEQGVPCRVIAATEVMYNRPCYRVEFSDGTYIVADADHLWYVESRRTGGINGKRRCFEDHLWTTEKIYRTIYVESPSNVKNGRIERNHSVPVAGALRLPDRDLPLSPYVLGVWLGDGSTATAIVTCGRSDQELVDHLRAEGIEPVIHERGSVLDIRLKFANPDNLCRRGHPPTERNARGRCLACDREVERSRRQGEPPPPYVRVTVQEVLRELGVLGDKHIPIVYLRSSERQRMALLQGLMDTDGYVSRAGQCEFTTTNERLAHDVLELLCSLGYKPTLKVDRAKLNKRDCGSRYRIQFFSYADRPAFRLSRKRARLKPPPERPTRASNRKIIAVEPVPSVPVRCIQVDSPSGMYLAGKSMIPTHNSTIAAGVALYLLFADGEMGAEVFSAAADRDQAAIVFNTAKQMVEMSPELAKRAEVYKNAILVPATGSVYRVLSADAPTKHGLNAHGIIFDELHAQPNRELWDVLTTSIGARRQPLVFAITTAGYDRNSICWEQHEYARQVQEGIIDDPSFLPCIYAADEKDDWRDEVVWHKANPSLGVALSLEYLREEARRAEHVPAYQNTFRRLHLNQWTSQEERWLDMAEWDGCAAPVDAAQLKGRECYGGLDLASTSDIAAFVLVFPPRDGEGLYQVLPFFWIPRDNMYERSLRDRVPYDAWVREGLIEATPGKVIDFDHIRHRIEQLAQVYHIREIAFDRWGAIQISQALEEAGLTMVQFGQGFASMSPPTKELLRLVLDRRIAHGGHPVLRWMADNLVVKQDPAGNVKPDKAKSREKIDGMVALIMALDRALRREGEKTSIYEERGLLWL